MAFLSKKLPRRTILKGLGTTMALPFLDAMLPPMRAAVRPSNRFQAFYVPNGMAMEYWTPKGEGPAFELSPILEPLAALQRQAPGLLRHQGQLELHSRRGLRIVSNRHTPRRTQRNRDHRRRLHRSATGPALRTGNPTGLARNVDGPPRQRRSMHRQPELCLSRHTLVAQPHSAAAHGLEPAHRLRKTLWRQRQHR